MWAGFGPGLLTLVPHHPRLEGARRWLLAEATRQEPSVERGGLLGAPLRGWEGDTRVYSRPFPSADEAWPSTAGS